VAESSGTLKEEWYRDGVYAFGGDVPYTASKTWDNMVDETVPNYYARMKKGELFFNPMVREKYSLSGVPSCFTGSAMIGNRTDSGTLVPRGPLVSSPTPLVESVSSYPNVVGYLLNYGTATKDTAVTAAWSDINQSTLQLLVSAGEAKETLQYAVTCLNRAKLLLQAARGRVDAIRKLKKSLQKGELDSYWMEARYAIRPLLYEIAAALDLLKEQLVRNPRLTARGFDFRSSVDVSEVTHLYDAWTGVVYQKESTVIHTCRAGLLYGLQNDSVTWEQVLGLDQPIGALFDLTKLSFVLGWFMNISDYISSWEANASSVIFGSWYTERVITQNVYIPLRAYCTWDAFGYTNIDVTCTPGSVVEKREVSYRNPYAPQPTTPSFRIRMDVGKAFDLAVIIKQIALDIMRR
jgi:hypothetical protein